MQRRRYANTVLPRWLGAVALAFFAAGAVADTPEVQQQPEAEAIVYKSPWCGCCSEWVEHLEEHGFQVKAIDSSDMNAVKKRLGVPVRLASCHTAIINEKYVIEGHVPAAEILRLVSSGADLNGLAVPGMPGGSPGMESAPAVAYEVLSFDAQGNIEVYAKYGETAP